MIQAIILKNAIPFAIGAFISASSIIGILHYTKQPIKVECPQPQVNVSCPPPKIEGNGIDIEKLKNFKGHLHINQQYRITANGDSLISKRLLDSMRQELSRLRVVKCR